MCQACWEEEYGSAAIDSAKTRDLAEAIRLVYLEPDGIVGGGLHVVIDDWNLEDESVTASDPRNDAERSCRVKLLDATVAERASALALHDGYWS
jgi:hypothetical protein